MILQQFKACTSSHGPRVGSPYPKQLVPIELFKDENSGPNGKIYTTCLHCRLYDRKIREVIRNKHKNLGTDHNNKVADGDIKYGYCQSQRHDSIGSKFYPRDQVPLDSMRKFPGNKSSKLHKQCAVCREYNNNLHSSYMQTAKESIITRGMRPCSGCAKELNAETSCKNFDGTDSALCITCKALSHKRMNDIRKSYHRIKLDCMAKNESSCVKCRAIYFKPSSPESLVVRRLDTYLRSDGHRYVNFNGIEYSAHYIFSELSDTIELGVIELDHLDESEQRSRGILLESDFFIPKTRSVCDLKSEEAMRLESLRTQPLCIKCHVEETIRRDNQRVPKPMKPCRKIKVDYIQSIKLNGCSSCGYINPYCPRFFDFDHIDPNTKIECIAIMAHEYTYTLSELMNEVAKCRVLCRFCHRIHTINQHKAGILQPGTIRTTNTN